SWMGKGKRNDKVVEAMKEVGAVYFGAVGGAAALISQRILSAEVIAYEDLGAEALHRFEVKDFPAVVLIDSLGNNVYVEGPKKYAEPDTEA
ncbi:MAG: fumarate hydratase C-terminal domain-containing protein, partial [Clostridia bacterium]|nr:fumarate hydratase C-terminal domain-containing protein [Clostridia bacterium]